MRFSQPPREEPQINLAPLIDVVFLLLIFFMVTTTFVSHAGLAIHLPKAGQNTVMASRQTLQASVTANDHILVQGKPVAGHAGALRAALQRAASGDLKRPLRIRADGRASHQAVVRVMNAASAVGFKQLDIATHPVAVDP